jgi:hypothetical protein
MLFFNMAKKKQYTEADRQRFANVLRTRSEHVLRRIADAYKQALESGETYIGKQFLFYSQINAQSLSNCQINNTPITYAQARVVYEMVFNVKYGGLNQNTRTSKGLAVFQRPTLESKAEPTNPQIPKETQPELDLVLSSAPEGYFPGLHYAVGARTRRTRKARDSH